MLVILIIVASTLHSSLTAGLSGANLGESSSPSESLEGGYNQTLQNGDMSFGQPSYPDFQLVIDGVVDSTKTSIPTSGNGSINNVWALTEIGRHNTTAYAQPVPGEKYVTNNFRTESIGSNYIRKHVPHEWVERGTAMGWHEDDGSWSYGLPFEFPFFDVNYSTIYISSNTLITFGGPDTSWHNSISDLKEKLAIAVAWADWATYDWVDPLLDICIWSNSSQVGIRWHVTADWDTNIYANFEVILWADGTIWFNYGESNVVCTVTTGISDGLDNSLVEDVIYGQMVDTIVFTTDIIPPEGIVNLATSKVTGDLITLTWTSPGEDGKTGTATGYVVKHSTLGPITADNWDGATTYNQTWEPVAAGNTENRTVSGLKGDTKYWFAVIAYDRVFNYGEISNSPSGRTSDIVSPSTIIDLAISGRTDTSITLTWKSPGDSGKQGNATGYIVKYSTLGHIDDSNWDDATTYSQSWTPLPANSNETRVISGLSSSVQYWFAIKAYDEVPNYSKVSNSPSETTAPPTAVLLSATVAAIAVPSVMAVVELIWEKKARAVATRREALRLTRWRASVRKRREHLSRARRRRLIPS